MRGNTEHGTQKPKGTPEGRDKKKKAIIEGGDPTDYGWTKETLITLCPPSLSMRLHMLSLGRRLLLTMRTGVRKGTRAIGWARVILAA